MWTTDTRRLTQPFCVCVGIFGAKRKEAVLREKEEREKQSCLHRRWYIADGYVWKYMDTRGSLAEIGAK